MMVQHVWNAQLHVSTVNFFVWTVIFQHIVVEIFYICNNRCGFIPHFKIAFTQSSRGPGSQFLSINPIVDWSVRQLFDPNSCFSLTRPPDCKSSRVLLMWEKALQSATQLRFCFLYLFTNRSICLTVNWFNRLIESVAWQSLRKWISVSEQCSAMRSWIVRM